MPTTLHFAIIGCGRIAPRHAEQAAVAGELVAVCDIIPERADALAAATGAKAYYDAATMFREEKNIDLVAVCTPNGLHAEHSAMALRSGAHVLCEKPMCLHTTEARQMMYEADVAGKKLFVVKSTRYNPSLIALKNMIEENKLGQVYNFQLNCFWNRPLAYYTNSWKGDAKLDGGTLFTQFSHYIDAMIWIFGDVKNISGYRKNMSHQGVIDFEDTGVAALEMESGVLGGLNWSVNSFQKNMEVSITVIAEKGTVRIAGEYMNRVDYSLPGGLFPEHKQGGTANDYGFYKGSMSNHDQVYKNLMLALEDDDHPFTRASEGFKTVNTIERIYQLITL